MGLRSGRRPSSSSKRRDAAGDGARLDLGYTDLVLHWLGLSDDAGCVERYGIGIEEALVRDCGGLAPLARIIEGAAKAAPAEALEGHALVILGWFARADRLMRVGAERPASRAIERALDAFPEAARVPASFWELAVELADGIGGSGLAERVRRRAEAAARAWEAEGGSPVSLITHVALAALWCRSHGRLLLSAERDLDSQLERSPEAWERVRAAALAGRAEDLPLPIETLGAWLGGEIPCREALRERFVSDTPGLALAVSAVEWLWAGADGSALPDGLRRQALCIARARRDRIDRGYQPPHDGCGSVWHELHQGARRQETLERVTIIHGVHAMLREHGADDPDCQLVVLIDLAREGIAQGRYGAVREYLGEVERLLPRGEDRELRERGQVILAEFAWASGDIERALGLLAGVCCEESLACRRGIEARADRRRAVRSAERAWRRRGRDLESASALVRAHAHAGHCIRAERIADAICISHLGRSVAWITKARALCASGRYRDAVEPAQLAHALWGDAEPIALLARVLSRTGPEGRRQSVGLASAAAGLYLEGNGGGDPLEALAELADVVLCTGPHDEEALAKAREADDRVLELSAAAEPPEEWLGAAAARRCIGAWTHDAPAWIAGVAEAAEAEPIELARWVVDRVEYLQCCRVLLGRDLLEPPTSLPLEVMISAAAREFLLKRSGRSVLVEGVRIAYRAALSLGYSPSQAGAALSLSGQAVDALGHDTLADPLAPFAFERHASVWEPHLRAIEREFGATLAVRLRATEIAQRAFREAIEQSDEVPGGMVVRVLATIDHEKIAWIRHAADQPALAALIGLDEGALAPGTRRVLSLLLDLSARDDDAIENSAWPTRWHDRERGGS